MSCRLQIINDPTAPSGDRLRAMEQLERRVLGKPRETVEQVADEPEFVKELRALTHCSAGSCFASGQPTRQPGGPDESVTTRAYNRRRQPRWLAVMPPTRCSRGPGLRGR